MDLEALHQRLLAIAHHIGPLNADAVRTAQELLSLPRYAASNRPDELLVDDIKQVIAAIPDDGTPKSLDRGARLFFSLEETGTNITHRKGALQPAHGTADMWATQAILKRVLLGLLTIEERTRAADIVQDAGQTVGFVVESISLIRHVDKEGQHLRDSLDFEISLLSPGPHFVALPFPDSSETEVTSVRSDHPNVEPFVEAASVHYGNTPWALAFGLGQAAGDRLGVSVEHKLPGRLQRWYEGTARRGPRWPSLSYRVDQPTKTLRLGLELANSRARRRIEVAEAGAPARSVDVIYQGDGPSWSCATPVVGRTYWLAYAKAKPATPDEVAEDIRKTTLLTVARDLDD